MADENLFSDDSTNTDITIDTLVGEGKKYRDANALAKAYDNIENHANELRADIARLRAEKDSQNPPDRTQEQPPKADPPQTPPVETPKLQTETKDLRELVNEVMRETQESAKFESNVNTTAERLIEHFGDSAKAQEAIRNRAKELGVNVEWLRDIAARSPDAFYGTMGLANTPPASRETPNPKNEKRATDFSSGKKDYRYFQNLRRENKNAYYSTEVQAEMQRLAREQGDAFYT